MGGVGWKRRMREQGQANDMSGSSFPKKPQTPIQNDKTSVTDVRPGKINDKTSVTDVLSFSGPAPPVFEKSIRSNLAPSAREINAGSLDPGPPRIRGHGVN